jgi:transposase
MDKYFLSLRESCLKFNIPSESVIIKWRNDFTNFGLEGLQPKPKGRPKAMNNIKRKKRKSDKPLTREEELLKENEALRCENDLLKKLHALIQAEEKAKKRKL